MSEVSNCCHTNEGEFEKICGKESEEMRWSKKNKKLILEVIENEKRMLKIESERKKFMDDDCPFCPHCRCNNDCPNFIISELLDCINSYCNFCYGNAQYIGLEFHGPFPLKSKSNIKKRINFWKDALILTKREFLKVYKKRNAQHKTIPA